MQAPVGPCIRYEFVKALVVLRKSGFRLKTEHQDIKCLHAYRGGVKINPSHTSSVAPKLALSRNEAAAALGVSPVTIDRLASRGLLKPSRATRRPLYAIWEIERFLKETTGAIPA